MIIAAVGFATVLILSFVGLPLGLTSLAVGLVGFAFLRGWNWDGALTMMGQQVMETAANYGFSVIPLFVLMGIFIHRSSISDDLFQAANALVGRRKGGLAHATVLACAGFSAVSGSSLATSATMAKVAIPHMRRFGYSDRLSSGVVAAGGTLGIMIPPSVPLVIYAIVSQQDVGKLFAAGFVPGILLVILFLGVVWVTVRISPQSGPSGVALPREVRMAAYAKVWPIVVLFVIILGGIYLGVFTPTEAAGIGAMGAAAFAFFRGRLRSPRALFSILIEACQTSAMLFVVIFGAQVFAIFINLSGLPFVLLDMITAAELAPIGVVIMICLVCVVMGMIFEAVGILLLLVPIFLPTLIQLDVDLIWFGIVVVVVVELGLITPPIGMNVFTVHASVPDLKLSRIFAGVAPFVVADLIALGLIILFPWIAVGVLRFV